MYLTLMLFHNIGGSVGNKATSLYKKIRVSYAALWFIRPPYTI